MGQALEAFQQDLDAMLAYVKTSKPLDEDDPVRVPAELEARMRRRRSADGITIEDATWQRIADLANRLGVSQD